MKKRIPAAALSLALALSLAAPASALDVAQARKLLEEHYVDPIPAAALEAESVDEMLRLLGDPYTVYYTAEEYESFISSVNGETVVGIGVSLQNAFDDGVEILSVLPDSPALEAGLQPGDRVIAVEGVTLTAQDNVASLITGEAGTSVTITICTQAGQIKDVTMVRRAVQIPTVTYSTVDGAGVIDCSTFGERTSSEIQNALSERNDDVSVWIMDLRSNPGGTSNAAVASAGLFLGSEIMVYFRERDGSYYYTQTTNAVPDLTDKPLIILTSTHSASASELFSGAIRDHAAGISVGQRTYGKGVAQHAYDQDSHPELFDGDAFKITVYRFFSPDGATNHLTGVIPTLLVDELYTDTVALLLSGSKPIRAQDNLKLELAGHTFYLDQELCRRDSRAFAQLLQALPPSAVLYRGLGYRTWREISPTEVAQRYELVYQARTFPDLEGSQYRREIETLAAYELVSGCDDGLFHPERNLTRAQLCVMLASALNLPASDTPVTFSDVSPDAWYADAVAAMAAKGFVAGTDHGTFLPDATLTNQELYAVLSSVAAWCSMAGHELSQTNVSAGQWLDVYLYPEWAQGAARNMVELGLDIDRENPEALVSRGAAAGMLCRLMENTHMLWNN